MCYRSTVLAVGLVSVLGTLESSGAPLDPAPYDRNHDGVLQKGEAVIWLLHSKDATLAKFDKNFDGKYSADEADKLREDSEKTLAQRKADVENDALFYSNKSLADIRALNAVPDKPDPCAKQDLFIRRDRLDTFQFRNSTVPIAGAEIARTDAKGASLSFTRDNVASSQALTVNGRVSYVLFRNDPGCPAAGAPAGDKQQPPADPYSNIPNLNTPSPFSMTVASWVDAQGTANDPKKKGEQSSLQGGADFQLSFVGGKLFDLQYFVVSPYAQTDLRGFARAKGVRGAWEPFNRDAHLGGRIGVPNPYFDWFWQFQGEVDWRHVDDAGVTGLTVGNLFWIGSTTRLQINLFPDRSKIYPLDKTIPSDLVNRFYLTGTYQYYTERYMRQTIHNGIVEVGYHLTPDGKSSISLQYSKGTDKDTLAYADKYVVGLNYKY